MNFHLKYILVDPNLLTSRIICLDETKVLNIYVNNKKWNVLKNYFHVYSCHNCYGTMILYKINYVIVTNKQYKIFWCRIHYYIFQQNYKLKQLIYFQFINLFAFIFSFNIEWKFAKYACVEISNNNNWWFQHINMLNKTFESISL